MLCCRSFPPAPTVQPPSRSEALTSRIHNQILVGAHLHGLLREPRGPPASGLPSAVPLARWHGAPHYRRMFGRDLGRVDPPQIHGRLRLPFPAHHPRTRPSSMEQKHVLSRCPGESTISDPCPQAQARATGVTPHPVTGESTFGIPGGPRSQHAASREAASRRVPVTRADLPFVWTGNSISIALATWSFERLPVYGPTYAGWTSTPARIR
jgi:hypothetical protein